MGHAFITGATSGIGRATATALADGGYNLIVCGRRNERLDHLVKELGQKVQVIPLAFDMADLAAIDSAIESLSNSIEIDILINNAGNAHGLHPCHEADFSDWERMIDINLKGLMYLTRRIIPSMVERKCGHIINVGSIAGKEVYPRGNGYCATKFAVDAFTKGLRIDLLPYGIKVGAINPGLVETEFSEVRFKGDSERAKGVYEGFTPLYAQDIAHAIFFMVSRPVHVNIADMLVFPTAQGSATSLYKESNS